MFRKLMALMLALVAISVISGSAMATVHEVKVQHTSGSPFAGLEVLIWIQTGPDSTNFENDWQEFDRWTALDGTCSVDVTPNSQALSWYAEVVDGNYTPGTARLREVYYGTFYFTYTAAN